MASLLEILQQAGFTGQGLRMALAIAMAESRGRADAYNGDANTGDQSYGLFQINMLGAMGPERRRQYNLASNTDLFDPLTNAKVAFQMSHGGTSWGPWSTYTSGAYRQYLGTSGGGDVGAASGTSGTLGTDTTNGTAGVAPATVKLDPKTLAAMYGLSTALINSDKSLKDIFNQAVSQQWTADVFAAHLKNTKWWATQSDTMRQFVTLKYTDPATFQQKWDQAAYHVNSLGVAVGYGNMLDQGTQLGKMNGVLQNAVLKVMQNGWSDQQVSDYLGGMIQFHGKEMDGQAGQEYDKLQTYAYANGLPLSSSWYLNNVRDIVGGKTTSEAVMNELRQKSASMYSAYSQQILAGQNALDLAAPYVHEVSQLLEIPELSIGMNNKYVQKAMTTPLGKGQMAGSQYPLWQLENDVRNDPLWNKTNNARETTAQVTRQIGQIFGGSF